VERLLNIKRGWLHKVFAKFQEWIIVKLLTL
jgi:hypothetical protein